VDCTYTCPPGSSPNADWGRTGEQQTVQCDRGQPIFEQPCEPLTCGSPTSWINVQHVVGLDCNLDVVPVNTTCEVECERYHFYEEEDRTYKKSFVCEGANWVPSEGSGTFSRCLIQGSSLTVVKAVKAALVLGLSPEDRDILVHPDNQPIVAAAQEKALLETTDYTAEVLLPIVPLGGGSSGARRLQGEALARVDFVLHGGEEANMLAAANAVKEDPSGLQAKVVQGLADSCQACAVCDCDERDDVYCPCGSLKVRILSMKVSRPEVVDHVVAVPPELTPEDLERMDMRMIAIASGSAAAFVCCIMCFWSKLKPLIMRVTHKCRAKLVQLLEKHGGGPGRMRSKDAEERSALWTDSSRTNFGDGTSKNRTTTVAVWNQEKRGTGGGGPVPDSRDMFGEEHSPVTRV
jgi:hypothetical protein